MWLDCYFSEGDIGGPEAGPERSEEDKSACTASLLHRLTLQNSHFFVLEIQKSL